MVLSEQQLLTTRWTNIMAYSPLAMLWEVEKLCLVARAPMQISHIREVKVALAQAKTTIMVCVQALHKRDQLVQTLKESPIKKMHITLMVHLPIHLA